MTIRPRVSIRPLRRRAFLASTAGVFLPCAAARAQDQARRDSPIFAWRDAVTQHGPGQMDEPATRVAEWTRDDLESLLSELRRLPQGELAPLAHRALLLHTDVAVLSRLESGYALPATGRSLVVIADGQITSGISETFHWEFCRRVLRMFDRPARRAAGLLWYQAVASVLFTWGEHPELVEHLRQGLEDLGDDAELWLARGAVHHVSSGPSIQRVFDDPRAVRSPILGTVDQERRAAAVALRRAIELDPTLAAAHVRLAHVLTDGRQHTDALHHAERAHALASDSSLRYYALLIDARAAIGLGEYDRARRVLGGARRLFPDAQSPRVAEAFVAHMTGAALPAGVFTVSADTRNSIGDMWWWVERTTWPTSRSWLARFRTAPR